MNPLSILRESLHFFIGNLPAIARLCLPLVALEGLLRASLASLVSPPGEAWELLLRLLVYPLYSAALILFMQMRSRQRQVALLPLLLASLPLWPSFAVLCALSSLLIMVSGALFLPLAIWLMVRLAFAEYLLVLHRLPALQAIRDSIQLSRGHFWSLLACVLLTSLPFWLLDGWSRQLLGQPPDLVDGWLINLSNDFLQLFASVVMFRCFMLCSPPATVDNPG